LAGGSAFEQIFKEVHSEVTGFIEHGASDRSVPSSNSAMNTAMRLYGNGRTAATDLPLDASQQAFIQKILPIAEEAGAQLGVAPKILAAQAALETGWGKSPIRNSNGEDTHNLFAIKSGSGWQGNTATSLTTEYQDDLPEKQIDTFRSYADDKSAMQDFAKLLQGNARYRSALNTGTDIHAYAAALAQGGYATDPSYAAKLSRIAERIQSGD
jgi:flagellar protein FlgJ